MSLPIDDPRLTAFALSEPLSEADRRAVEQWLAESADARAGAADIRDLALALQAAYEAGRQTTSRSREIDNIIEFSAPHTVRPQTPWATHLLRIAAMIAVSAAIVAVGLITRTGTSRQPLLTGTNPPPADWPMPEDDMSPPDQVTLSVPRDDSADASSYAQVRRSLTAGALPRRETVRIAEMLNHFSYLPANSNSQSALQVDLEVAAAPWQPQHRLVRIYLRARERDGVPNSIIARNLATAVNFNPLLVAAYRRIGNDATGPGAREIAAGYAVTELYEIIPAGTPLPPVDRSGAGWQRPEAAVADGTNPPGLFNLTMNFQSAEDGVTHAEHFALVDDGRTFDSASADFKFAAAVAGFGLLLGDSPDRGIVSPGLITAWARAGRAEDPGSQRSEFIEMVRVAGTLLAARSGSS